MIFQPDWIVASSSILGNSHAAANKPCQDAYWHLNMGHGWGVAVVSDGAGSYAYSHYGSRFTARDAAHHFRNEVYKQGWMKKDSLPEEKEWKVCAQNTLFAVRGRLEGFAQQHELSFAHLGCTIIVVIYSPLGLLVTHIGDGRAGYSADGKQWEPMMIPYQGESPGSTVFITLDIWELSVCDRFIESRVIKGPVQAFCLLSDGCEDAAFECWRADKDGLVKDNNTPQPLFLDPNVEALRKMHAEGLTPDQINARWTQFLEGGNSVLKNEPDDKTMILSTKTFRDV